MMTLYHCLECEEIFSLVDPGPGMNPFGDEGKEVNSEWLAHRAHALELLTPVDGSTHSRDPYDAPQRTLFFLATNGREEFLVVKKRNGHERSCRYELRKGRILPLPPVITLGEENILRQIIWEKKGTLPTAVEIAAFIRILHDCTMSISCSDLLDEEADFHYPLLSRSRPPLAFFKKAAERSQSAFPEKSARWFLDFINRNLEGSAPFWLEVRRDFEIAEKKDQPAEEINAPLGKAAR